MIKLLAGLIRPTEGTIQLLGANSPEEISRVQANIGYMIETPAVYTDMTAEQNLEVRRLEKGIEDKNCADEALALVNLLNNHKKVKNYSLGMKQRLALALALLGQPELLIPAPNRIKPVTERFRQSHTSLLTGKCDIPKIQTIHNFRDSPIINGNPLGNFL